MNTSIDMKSFNLFEKSVALSLKVHRFGLTKKGDKAEIKTDADTARLSLGVKLLSGCKEINDILSHLNDSVAWIKARSAPSFFRGGLYLFKVSSVGEVEAELGERAKRLSALIEATASTYDAAVESDKATLAGQFNSDFYPPFSEVAKSYGMEWNWISLGVPDNLPKDVLEAEKAKAEKLWSDAAVEIRVALRKSFAGLVDWAAEKLRADGTEKPKSFHYTTLEKMQEFIKCFELRDITNDAELAMLVAKAKAVFSVDGDMKARADFLREQPEEMKIVGDGFSEIKAELDKLIQEPVERAFNF